MHVVAIMGSPRREGNSCSLAKVIINRVASAGASVDTYILNQMSFRGCQGCSACKGKSDKCIVRDELTPVLQAVIDCDVLLLATPIYWGDISGQMKLFIDRTYSFLKPDFKDRPDKHRLPPGKYLIWVETQGAENEALFKDVFERYNNFFSQLKYFENTYHLRACGMSTGVTVELKPEILAQAVEIADRVTTDFSGR